MIKTLTEDAKKPLPSTHAAIQELRTQYLGNPLIREFVSGCRDSRRSLPDLLFALTTFGFGVACVVTGSEMRPLQLVGTLLLILFLSCVSSLTHESWHGSLSTSRRINNTLSRWILSPLLVADFDIQQRNHLRHHSNLGEESDPDGRIYRLSTGEFITMLTLRLLVFPYFLKLAGLRKEASTNGPATTLVTTESLMRIAFVHSIWVLIVAIGTWGNTNSPAETLLSLALGYALPLAVASLLVATRGHREHFVDPSTKLTITYDTNCWFLERWLIAGGNFNLHVCHHLFPEVSQRDLPQFAALLQKNTNLVNLYSSRQYPVATRGSYLKSGDA